MELDKIKNQIKKEVTGFKNLEINITDNYSFNHYETLNLINLYLNSRYKKGNKDDEGFRKFFFNVVNKAWRIAAKATDIDTKHIKFETEAGQSYYPVWLLEKDFQYWMKENRFDKLLNEIIENTPKYGTTVVKKSKDKIKIVKLDNLIFDPSVENLEDSPFITEKHCYSAEQLWAKQDVWENAKDVVNKWFAISKNRIIGENDIDVYESYRLVKKSEIGEKGEDLVRAMFLMADIGKNQELIPLIEKPIIKKEIPYKACHWERVFGRFLGRGVVEEGFENQMRQNLLINLLGKTMYWTSKVIFQSRSTIDKNLAAQTLNGEVLEVDEEITRIPIENRDLSSFNNEFERWAQNYNEKTFNYDIFRGERPPAGTPLGTSRIQVTMIQSYFSGKQENIGIFIKELLTDWIIPIFIKNNNNEHILNLIGTEAGELKKFDNMKINYNVNKEIIDFVNKNGYLPTPMQVRLIRQIVKSRQKKPNNRTQTIVKNLYKNLKYKVKIIITGEAIDMGSELQTLQIILQQLSTNPAIFQNPMIKQVFYRILDKVGISPIDFETEEDEEENMLNQQLSQGGSISVPNVPNIPMGGKELII